MSDTQLDHIKYMGLTRRREGAARETYPGRPARDHPLPEPGRTAFQSPLLEYSAALGEGQLSPYCQPGPPPLHRALRYTPDARTHAGGQYVDIYRASYLRLFENCQTIVSKNVLKKAYSCFCLSVEGKSETISVQAPILPATPAGSAP